MQNLFDDIRKLRGTNNKFRIIINTFYNYLIKYIIVPYFTKYWVIY